METTIAVKESTVQMLMRLKKSMGARSMDEVIVTISRKAENLPASRFGSQPKLKPFRSEERGLAHEL